MGDVRGTVALAVVRRLEWPEVSDEPDPGPVGAAEEEAPHEASEADTDPIEAGTFRASPQPKRTPRKKSMAAEERRKNMEPPFRDE
jgi:hypothetical protein